MERSDHIQSVHGAIFRNKKAEWTGLNAQGSCRDTLHRLYNETATRVELDVIDVLCRYLDIQVGELFEIIEGNAEDKSD
ncbi:hypothetical protein CBP31_13140 [Oceanisphaera profunda]|uniref:HTH cro/C1-type domain-containing protein n=1 Tax=Oceanisphaera profunda TaxID=1416627 RepID=A0A1Y0D7B3_9GAMM|nr:helix-turn-helix transcriptional regulator [Oceanisphaera profunda]ART83452.1 hypothetical protein CBP31_13140 [Oceanisphaera profunda]